MPLKIFFGFVRVEGRSKPSTSGQHLTDVFKILPDFGALFVFRLVCTKYKNVCQAVKS